MTKNHRHPEPVRPCDATRRRPRRALRVLALPLAFIGLLAAAPAQAESADRDKPVNLEADRVTVDETKQTATFVGNVVLTQGTLTIRGDRMIVQQDADGFKTGTAYGNLASFRQKRDGIDEYVEGYAERIEYDSKADKVQMFNRAYLKKGLDEVRGNYISYDVASEFFRVTGGGKQAADVGRSLFEHPQTDQRSPRDSGQALVGRTAAHGQQIEARQAQEHERGVIDVGERRVDAAHDLPEPVQDGDGRRAVVGHRVLRHRDDEGVTQRGWRALRHPRPRCRRSGHGPAGRRREAYPS